MISGFLHGRFHHKLIFEGLSTNARIYPALPAEKPKEFYQVLSTPGTYYPVAQTLDAQGLRSPLALAPPITLVNAVSQELVMDLKTGINARPGNWESGAGIRLDIRPKPQFPGQSALNVKYEKTGSWDYWVLNLDQPLDVKPYRFLKVEVYGHERLIVKLFTTPTSQEDIGTLTAEKPEQWNELAYDLSTMYRGKADLGDVRKLLVFPAPGEQKSGEFFIGKIWLSD